MNDLGKSQTLLRSLLPLGFEDLLPPQAEAEFRGIAVLMACFARFGYVRVKPPLAEFEESLLAPGPGAATADQTFRVMDPQSERMLALRSDITAQIARIATSRMADAPKPLRLTYANDVIRTRASQQRTLRQFAQVGCEIVGGRENEDVIEMAVIALKGLSDVGLSNVSIDFSLPQIVDAIFTAAGLSPDDVDSLRASLAGSADGAIKKLDALGLNDAAKVQVENLKVVLAGVQKAVSELGIENVSYTVDPLEIKGFEYHDGVTFTLFCKDAHGEIGRGGRYGIECDETKCSEKAAGFTLYMDTVRTAMPAFAEKARVFVPMDAGWDVLQELQSQKYITVRGFDGDDALKATCTHQYKDGTVQKI